MQKAEDFYGDMTYDEVYQRWSTKYASADYKPHELEAIHRRWKALGKAVSHGPAVAIRANPRRRRAH